MNVTPKILLAISLLALAPLSTFAADTGAGDRGPINQVGPQSPSDTPPGNSADLRDARRTAESNYRIALSNCRAMPNADRATCRKDARVARDEALRNPPNTSMLEYSRPAPGTTPADRGERAMSRSPEQQDARNKP